MPAKTHGKWGTPEYNIWALMKTRCTNEKNHAYPRYGGRGIKICERWLNSFEAFLEDMGERPFARAALDRIDNDGDYCKENCRWVTQKVNNNNKSTCKFIEHDGRIQTVAQWAEEVGIEVHTLRDRLKAGWTIKDALTRPTRKMNYAN